SILSIFGHTATICRILDCFQLCHDAPSDMAEFITASDLVALIKQLYPQAAATGNLLMLDDGHAGELSLILEYVKRIDPRVLSETLPRDEIRRWERATARMEAASRTWASGGKTTLLAPPGGNDPHPIIQVHLIANRLPDQAKPISVNRLPFVTDADL